MKRDLRDKRILITGASRGMGRAIAARAAARGARLVLAARSAGPLAEAAAELARQGAEALPVPADLTRAEDRARLLATVRQRLGGLDVLINNAGVGSFGHFFDSTEAILRQVLETNFFAPAELLRGAIPLLAEGTQPAVVNLASMCGRRGMPAWPEYSASKFALVGLSEAVRAELGRYAIELLVVLPGLTRTDLPQNLLRNEGRAKIGHGAGMAPEYVGERVCRALERGQREIVLGNEAVWMLRIQRWLPGLVEFLLARKVRQLYAT
jgi:short-subunit dehydrogenase